MMADHEAPALIQNCVTCKTALQGKYCHQCGEKMPNPHHDFAISEFIENTIDGFTHFDLKILRTFRALLLQPGKLTAEYSAGRHTPYMKPVQLFIVASVIFFFVSPNTGSFYALLEEMQSDFRNGLRLENIFRYDVDARVQTISQKNKASARDVWLKVEQNAATKSKAFLFAMLPLWAFVLYLLHYAKKAFYVPHLVFAIHSFSFFLLVDLLYINALFLFTNYISDLMIAPLLLVFLIYVILGLKTAFANPLWKAMLKGLIATASLLVLIVIYRQLITIWSLHSV